MLIIIKVLTIFLALGELTVVMLAVLGATAEMVRLRFGKRIRSRRTLKKIPRS